MMDSKIGKLVVTLTPKNEVVIEGCVTLRLAKSNARGSPYKNSDRMRISIAAPIDIKIRRRLIDEEEINSAAD